MVADPVARRTQGGRPDADRPRRLRVMQLGKYYAPAVGGIESHVEALSNGLRRFADVEVVVSSPDRHRHDDNVEGVRVVRVPTLATLRGAPISPGLIDVLRRFEGDLIHLHWPNPFAAACVLAARPNARLIVSYHSDIVRQRILAALLRPLHRALLRRASAIVVPTARHGENAPLLHEHRDRWREIPYGIDPSGVVTADAAAVTALRQRFGDRVVLAVGRLVYYKGFDVLVRAMVQVRGRLLVVGEGPLRSRLERLAADLGVADRVHLLGRVDDLAPLYRAADVFALPSTQPSEAFGIVQLEAMAAGIPVVNTALPTGVPLVSVDGVTGMTVRPGAVDPLAAAIQSLLDEPDLRRRYGDAGALRVARSFSVEVMVSRMCELYDEVSATPAVAAETPATPTPTSLLP